jgi:hypothetical protein
MNALAKLTLPLLTEESADPAARTAMESARKSLGFVPNLYASSSSPQPVRPATSSKNSISE